MASSYSISCCVVLLSMEDIIYKDMFTYLCYDYKEVSKFI